MKDLFYQLKKEKNNNKTKELVNEIHKKIHKDIIAMQNKIILTKMNLNNNTWRLK